MSASYTQKINTFLRITFVSIGIFLVLMHFVPGSGFYKLPSYLATIALVFAPDLLARLGLNLSQEFRLACYLFMIPAMILGIDFDLYKVFYPLDKISHFLSGVAAVFFAKEILTSAHQHLQPRMEHLFCFCVSATIAVLWECFEFSYDQIFHGSMQQLITPGPEDTMYDMISAMCGAALTIGIIYFSRLSSRPHKNSNNRY